MRSLPLAPRIRRFERRAQSRDGLCGRVCGVAQGTELILSKEPSRGASHVQLQNGAGVPGTRGVVCLQRLYHSITAASQQGTRAPRHHISTKTAPQQPPTISYINHHAYLRLICYQVHPVLLVAGWQPSSLLPPTSSKSVCRTCGKRIPPSLHLAYFATALGTFSRRSYLRSEKGVLMLELIQACLGQGSVYNWRTKTATDCRNHVPS